MRYMYSDISEPETTVWQWVMTHGSGWPNALSNECRTADGEEGLVATAACEQEALPIEALPCCDIPPKRKRYTRPK